MNKTLTSTLWIVAFQVIGGGIGYLTNPNIDGWYGTLKKSALNPPGYVFGIVWPILYVLLAIAAWKMWRTRKEEGDKVLFMLFWTQMFLNWSWSFVFFEFHLISVGFWWIVALDLTMLAFIFKAWQNYRSPALLVSPTLLWGCFAAYLNYSIWVLN